jgi:hypothetical protein
MLTRNSSGVDLTALASQTALCALLLLTAGCRPSHVVKHDPVVTFFPYNGPDVAAYHPDTGTLDVELDQFEPHGVLCLQFSSPDVQTGYDQVCNSAKEWAATMRELNGKARR